MTVCQEQFLQLLQSHGTQECKFSWPPEAGDLGVSAGRHQQKTRSPDVNTGAAKVHGGLGDGASGEAVTAPVAGAKRRRSAKGALAEKEKKKKEILERKRKISKGAPYLALGRQREGRREGEQEEGTYQPP